MHNGPPHFPFSDVTRRTVLHKPTLYLLATVEWELATAWWVTRVRLRIPNWPFITPFICRTFDVRLALDKTGFSPACATTSATRQLTRAYEPVRAHLLARQDNGYRYVAGSGDGDERPPLAPCGLAICPSTEQIEWQNEGASRKVKTMSDQLNVEYSHEKFGRVR